MCLYRNSAASNFNHSDIPVQNCKTEHKTGATGADIHVQIILAASAQEEQFTELHQILTFN